MNKRREQVIHAYFVEETKVQTDSIVKYVIQNYQKHMALSSIVQTHRFSLCLDMEPKISFGAGLTWEASILKWSI